MQNEIAFKHHNGIDNYRCVLNKQTSRMKKSAKNEECIKEEKVNTKES